MSKDSILARVKKLLNLADEGSGATEAEAAAAMQKAQDLLVEHKLEMSEVDGVDLDLNPITDDTDVDAGSYSDAPIRWMWNLLHGITDVVGVHAPIWYAGFGNKKRGGKKGRYKLIGKKADVAVAVEMYHYMVEQVERFYRESDYGPKGTKRGGITVKRNYCAGCATRIVERLKERKAELEAANPKYGELVVQEAALIESWMNDAGYKLKWCHQASSGHNAEARNAGRKAGNSASLDVTRKVNNGGTRAIA